MSDNKKGILFACFTALLWGFLAIILKMASQFLDSHTIVFARFSIAFLILLTIVLSRGRYTTLQIFRKPPLMLMVATVCLSLNYYGYMQGIHLTSPGNAQILIQWGPILLALSGIFIFKEKLSRWQALGFVIALCGFTLFFREKLINLIDSSNEYIEGNVWTLFGGTMWAIYAILQKKLVQRFSTTQLNLFIYGVASLLFLSQADLSQLGVLSLKQWAIVVFLGLNTLLAYGALAEALKYTKAKNVSIIITLNPVLTFILLGIMSEVGLHWVAPEQLTILSIVGAVGVLSGAIMIIGGKK
ncbi:DMT family transporter [Halosquirtibacter xylanolyticus]|uniref:DMT family transporter n=1 Tax=Halosquirtibacter xylanolyticus TaxID=3374599 RepID=UPI0037498B5E|nr:DMT family transporter [Prolixibacteraceae bacterium]